MEGDLFPLSHCLPCLVVKLQNLKLLVMTLIFWYRKTLGYTKIVIKKYRSTTCLNHSFKTELEEFYSHNKPN